MKVLVAWVLIAAGLISSARAEDPETIAAHMAGSYVVIGRHPDSEKTYQGQIVFSENNGVLKAIRTIDGKTVEATATMGTATGDKLPVLRIRFEQDGTVWEGIYQWKTDLDNYFRLTGYVFQPQATHRVPGLEVCFPADAFKGFDE